MKTLSVDFAFEGFRLLRAKPWLVLVWGLLLTVLTATGGFTIYHFGQPLMDSIGKGQADPKVMGHFMAIFLPAYFIAIIGALIISAVFRCAVFRAVLEERNVGLGYLRLGGDELRQIGAGILIGLIMTAAMAVVVVAGVLIFTGMSAAGQKVPAIWALVLGGIAAFLALIWVCIRLSLYSVQTFATRSINLFGSWRLTGGYFWTLLGGYLVACLLAGLVSEAGNMIAQIILNLTTGTSTFMPFSPGNEPKDIHAVLAVFTSPAFLTIIGLQIFLVVPITLIIQLAPSAAAYRALSGQRAEKVERVF